MPKSCKRFPALLLCLLALASGQAWSAAGPSDPVLEEGQRFALPGMVVVKFLSPVGPLGGAGKTGLGTVDRLLAEHGLESIEPLAPGLRAPSKPGQTDLSRIYLVRYGDGAASDRVALQLSRLDDVEYAEPLYAYPLAASPNDPSFNLQVPYVGHMQFPAAWDITKGEASTAVVAIIDGGTDWQHNDLAANIWENPGEIPDNGIDDDNNGFIDDVRGWNFANSTNDPKGLPSTPSSASHGTHTAGIVCAVTNNGLQVAGASWNAKVMPVNAAFASVDRVIAWGYPGIVYAAQNGADVISLSWGGSGNPSIFEQEVINFAWEQGAAVCAAAGNSSSSANDHFPSAYDHVLSVTNVGNDDRRVSIANFGYSVDIAAHGQSILSTIQNNQTGLSSGTSMSTPFVAGACALVKTRWPGYTADQVMQRVRVTSDNIAAQNPGFGAFLGYGRLNAFQALTKKTPAIRITDIQIQDEDGDGVIEAGELIDVELTVTNFLAQALSVNFDLTETSVFVTVQNPSQSVSRIDSLESVQLPTFQVQIAGNTPSNTKIDMALELLSTIPNYPDVDRFDFVVQPLYLNHAVNQIGTSVTSTGRLGYALELGGNGQDGIGFNFAGGPNVLFEAALMMGTSLDRLVDAARGVSDLEKDFGTTAGGTPHYLPPVLADEQSTASFSDGAAPVSRRVYVDVRQDAYFFATPPHDDYVILRYRIRNNGSGAITGLRVGWFQDWDIGDEGDADPAGGDRTGFDDSRGLGYMWDENGRANGVHVGTVVLTDPGTTIFRGIWNDDLNPSNPSFGVYSRTTSCSSCDGYTKSEKWQTLFENFAHPNAGPDDVSMAVGAGPFDIAFGDSIVVAFAFVAGNSLADLQANTDAALAKWEEFGPTTPVTLSGLEASLDGPDVVVRWQSADEKDITAYRVYRSRDGEPMQALTPDLPRNAEHSYSFRDATPAPGSYLYRVAAISAGGDVVLHGGVEVEVAGFTPGRSYLASGMPNPFNPSTTLRYGVSAAGPVRLVIHDARGRTVRTLVQTAYAAPGTYSATWNGLDDSGRAAPSGSYHVRLQVAGQVFTRRLTLLK